MSVQEQIALLAEEWVKEKVPYRHRGTSRRGCDCSGLLIGLLRELGYLQKYEYRLPYYSKDWYLNDGARDRIRSDLIKVADLISISQTTTGDIVLFKYQCQRYVAHLGIVIQPHIFAHCHINAARVCNDSLLRSAWTKRWCETWRLDPEKLEDYR